MSRWRTSTGSRLRRATVTVAAAAATLALVGAACGGSSDNGGDATKAAANPTATTPSVQQQPTATTAAAQQPAATTAAPTATADPMANTGGGSDLPTSVEVHAIDSKFDVAVIEAPANTMFSGVLVNDGVLPHNLSFFTEEGGAILADGANGAIILEGETAVTKFMTPGPGTYFFVCVVHPDLMKGDFIVK